MKPVYGRQRSAANAGVRETWMDRFTKLEPESGFRAVVRQAWNRSAPTPNGASALLHLNGWMEMKPVYGQRCVSAAAGARETWMDRFTKLEPAGGFHAIVEGAWNWSTSTSDKRLAA
jgi:hypothetical protein